LGWPGRIRPGGGPGRFRRDDSARACRFPRLRECDVRVGLGAADSLGGKLLRQGALGGIVLLLSRPGAGAGGVVSRDGAAWASVHTYQSLQRQPLLAALGG